MKEINWTFDDEEISIPTLECIKDKYRGISYYLKSFEKGKEYDIVSVNSGFVWVRSGDGDILSFLDHDSEYGNFDEYFIYKT